MLQLRPLVSCKSQRVYTRVTNGDATESGNGDGCEIGTSLQVMRGED
jgi:hypothetical protein